MNAKETAVIFIEFQNDFCHPEGKLYDLVQSELERNQTIAHAQTLLKWARQNGCKIFHCPFTLDKKWVSEINAVGLLEGLADSDIFVPESWGHEIIPELAPQNGEIVLEGKHALSAFSHTNLEQLLKFGGIRNLLVCGFLTNICVQATAWSAYDRGYQARIVPQACCAATLEIQDYVESQICPALGGAITLQDLQLS